jgi:diacylglycerol kinase family enzyme
MHLKALAFTVALGISLPLFSVENKAVITDVVKEVKLLAQEKPKNVIITIEYLHKKKVTIEISPKELTDILLTLYDSEPSFD